MKITIDELKKLCDLILAVPEKIGISEISVDVDYYWHISLEDGYKKKNPEPMLVGSLVDDMEWLEKVLKRENISTTIDLERLGHVIKAIGYEINRSTTKKSALNGCRLPIIKIADIKRLYDLLLKKAERANFKKFELTLDFYLGINLDDSYNFTKDPTPALKSVFENWNDLKKILENNRQPTFVDFERLGTMFEVIGEEINKSENIISWLTAE